jgi:hypothetical protein
MATTTNYGWTTPDDTALVKDGASAIRTLGTSVDTTTKALNPSTTLGDIEYRSSTANTNTRVGVGTTGQALTVVGGVPSWAASATSTLTTTGDTLYASSANTLSRLGIGSTGQVLTVAGGVPSWATASSGGMTLLTSGTLSGASISLTSISGSYKDLILRIYNFKPATDGSQCYLQFNSDTGSNYYSATSTTTSVAAATQFSIIPATDDTTAQGVSDTEIVNYASSSYNKLIENFASTNNSSTPTAQRNQFLAGIYLSTTAITSIQLTTSSGNFTSGNYELYGVK